MKKTIISRAIATVFAATGLITTATWASDREIYQRGGEGSAAVMISLDVSRTMREKFGTTDDGNSDYYGCVRSTKDPEELLIGNKNRKVDSKYCVYTDDFIKINNFFLRKKFPSYEEYLKKTCDFVPRNMWLSGRENNIYRCYDRLTRAKIALIALLDGDSERGISKLSDDKVIGLSIFPAYLVSKDSTSKHDDKAAAVVLPARRLDAEVTYNNTRMTQREALVQSILNTTDQRKSLWDKITENDNVPIGSALAESAAYLMGTTTNAGFREMQKAWIKWENRKTQEKFEKSKLWPFVSDCDKSKASSWDEFGQCTVLGWFDSNVNTKLDAYDDLYSMNERNGADLSWDRARFLVNDDSKYLKTSGYRYANPEILDGINYKAPDIIKKQVEQPGIQSCHAQGIYVVTGGLSHTGDASQGEGTIDFYMKRMMSRSLGDINYRTNMCKNGALKDYTNIFGNESNYIDNSSWSCISAYAEKLKTGANPVGLSIKTAVVGVGKQFEELPSSNLSVTTAENEAQLNAAIEQLETFEDKNSLLYKNRTKHNLKNTALLGLYGGGGWYSAMSANEIADSFNSFINVLAKDIPSASVNKAIIPVDILNPYELQPYAYLSMYEPTVEKTSSLWAGNLKRYGIGQKGLIVDQEKSSIFEDNGLIKDSSKDLWEKSSLDDIEKIKARLFQGGALNRLKLGHQADGTLQRKIYTTRECTEKGKDVTCKQDDSLELKPLNKDYFTNKFTKKDQYRGYLLALLGYDISNPNAISDEEIEDLWQYKQPELRQMGAILHSDPVLLTQKGKVIREDGQIMSKDRDDYVLFGTTQGLLHVLDADTGEEKFAFVPNEMVDKNYRAFVNPDLAEASGEFSYGIDGAWTVYSEYVPANQNDQTLTVGTNQSSKLSGKQWVYGGLRMGGNSYYALDLSNLDQPKLKFHIDPDTGKVYTPTGAKEYQALEYMGQSWSKPVITRVNWQGEDKLVMIVGGGYDDFGQNDGYEDPQYTQETELKSSPRTGAGVYMFDADTGDLLWWASSNVNLKKNNSNKADKSVGYYVEHMGHSVVSTIKTVDRDGDNLTDHLYFGDLGGQFWRIDLNNFPTTQGTKNPQKETDAFATHAVRLLNLRTSTQDTKNPRFYTQPTFSIHRIPGSGRVLAAISIGTGNASSPLHDPRTEPNWVPNAIYTIFDKDVTRSNLYKLPTTELQKDLQLKELSSDRRNNVQPAFDESIPGWKFTFHNNPFSLSNDQPSTVKFYSSPMSPKVITDPVLMDNQLFVSVFDSARSGTVQTCDAGIRGESIIERFCMPFGTCTSKNGLSNSLYAGIGIVPINVSSGGVGSQNSRTIINSQCEGDSCQTNVDGKDIGTNNVLNRKLRPLRWHERE